MLHRESSCDMQPMDGDFLVYLALWREKDSVVEGSFIVNYGYIDIETDI